MPEPIAEKRKNTLLSAVIDYLVAKSLYDGSDPFAILNAMGFSDDEIEKIII